MRLSPLRLFLLALFALLSGAPSPAQKDGKIQMVLPDKFERATAADAQGLLQWADYKPENCPNCNGNKTVDCPHCGRFDDNKKCIECQMKKKATCRACGGLGHFPDPLDKVVCPGCLGAGFFNCFVCGGRGVMKVTGSGDKLFDCVGCKGEGGFKCTVCNGARLVEVATFKPSLKETTAVPALQKAKDQIDAALKALAAAVPDGKNSRKDVKEYARIVTPATAALAPLKRCPKALEDVMNKIYAGSIYIGHEDHEADAIKQWQANTDYYLKHQQRILELCIARAEQNAKADKKDGEKKDE